MMFGPQIMAFLTKKYCQLGMIYDAISRAKKYVEFSDPSAQRFEAEEINQILGHKVFINEEDFSIDLE